MLVTLHSTVVGPLSHGISVDVSISPTQGIICTYIQY